MTHVASTGGSPCLLNLANEDSAHYGHWSRGGARAGQAAVRAP